MRKRLSRRHEWTELEELTEELRSTRLALRQAHGRFAFACDPLLIDANLYEEKALLARHAWLLRRVKELGGEAPR